MLSLVSFIKKYTSDSLSVLIIPHTGKGIKQIKFKRFIFHTFITTICSICIVLGILIYTLYNLNAELDSKLNDISRLQSMNVQKTHEIHDLKSKALVVDQKLSILDDLEIKVRDLVGLKTPVNTENTRPITRSLIREDYKSILNTPLSVSQGNISEEDENNIEVLAAQMDDEMENLNVLIEEVTGQLEFLSAKPTKPPVQGRITSKFGYRKSPFTSKTQFHKGIDIANSLGTKIQAAGSGVVTFSGWNSGYGRTIIISHGYGYRTVYAHNKELLVEVGDKVNQGDAIAKLGSSGKSTGPHVHFEIHYEGKQIDPLTVLEY